MKEPIAPIPSSYTPAKVCRMGPAWCRVPIWTRGRGGHADNLGRGEERLPGQERRWEVILE